MAADYRTCIPPFVPGIRKIADFDEAMVILYSFYPDEKAASKQTTRAERQKRKLRTEKTGVVA